jgi:methyltransferase (TIGR00027 family)
MEPNRASRTALITAHARAFHAAHDDPKILDDPVAHQLITSEDRQFLEEMIVRNLWKNDPDRAASCPDRHAILASAIRTGATSAAVLSRTRYAEDVLEEVVRDGVRQYVLLGAGLDTFAFRRADVLDMLQVIEVDHPATQAFKRQRLIDAGFVLPASLHFVPVDFTHESLETALTQSPYASHIPAFFGWLGVTMYLGCDTVFDTLRAMRSIAASGSHVVFDYLDTDAFVADKVSKRARAILENVRRLGEPMTAGFDPHTLHTDLVRVGWRLREQLTPQEIEKRYFQGRTDGYHAAEHIHFAWAIVE